MRRKIGSIIPPPFAYICSECAEKYGGTWPSDHCATVHVGKCGYCDQDKSLSALDDWDGIEINGCKVDTRFREF